MTYLLLENCLTLLSGGIELDVFHCLKYALITESLTAGFEKGDMSEAIAFATILLNVPQRFSSGAQNRRGGFIETQIKRVFVHSKNFPLLNVLKEE